MFDNIKEKLQKDGPKLISVILFGGIVCLIAGIIGSIIDSALNLDWELYFYLPLVCLVISLFILISIINTQYAEIIKVIVVFALLLFVLKQVGERYDVLIHAAANRETQSELDAAESIDSKFSKTRKEFRQYDDQLDDWTSKDVAEKLKTHNVSDAFRNYEEQAKNFMDRQDTLRDIENRTFNRNRSQTNTNSSNIQNVVNKVDNLPNERVVCTIGKKTRVYFQADYPFEVIFATDNGLTLVPMPAGKSYLDFGWGGLVRIVGRDRDDVKCIKTKKIP